MQHLGYAWDAAGANSYAYDANGNMVTRNGASIGWRSDNLPAVINAAGYSAQFDYAPDGQRWRQVSSYASGNETTIYVAGLLEKLTTPVRTHWKHLIPTPSGQVQHLRRSDGTSETLYLLGEHLGSVDAVLDAGGAVLARPSFNAWGARRSSSWSGSPSPGEWQAIANTSRRGYTGHEQIDNVMLVHMNGRVYDPAIGRFLSADPFIDCEQNTQGWNRYSYVKGAVLRYADPSGYKADDPLAPIRAIAPNDASPGLPIDPATGLETLTVTGSRTALPGAVSISVRFTPAPGPGGGGRQGRDPKKDKEKCVSDCRTALEPVVQAAAGAAGGGVAGLVAGARGGGLSAVGIGLAGAFSGGLTGFVTGAMAAGNVPSATAVTVGASFGTAAASVGVMLTAQAPSVAAALGGAAGGFVGVAAPAGALGAAASTANGAAIGGMLSNMSVGGLATPAVLGAAAAYATYRSASRVANEYCRGSCEAN